MSRRESNVDRVERARLPGRNLLAIGNGSVKYIDDLPPPPVLALTLLDTLQCINDAG
jgi:hypothetical protein